MATHPPVPRRPVLGARWPLWVASLLLCAWGGALRAETPAAHAVPEGAPVSLDGVVQPPEWEGALELPLGDSGASLRLLQRRGTLQIGLDAREPWPLRSNLTLWFCPAGEQAGILAPGAVRIHYEPREHDRSHVIVSRATAQGDVRVLDEVVARAALDERGSGIELAFNLGLLGLTTARRPELRFCVHWVRPYARGHVTWPAGLDFTGDSRPGAPPPDLARAARWGLLTGLGDPAQPGAFSRTDWTAWVEHDRELTRRGAQAHASVRLLADEWKKTQKRDGELEVEVLENLAWIARHEPLTPTDLLAQAKVLRYLNRGAQALGLLDALGHHAEAAVRQAALYERALTQESRGDLESAQADWRELARLVGEMHGGAYARKAEDLEPLREAWESERRAREEDDARDDLPLVALHTTRGVVLVQLFRADVPEAVAHFLGLVRSGFYDKTLFHRVQGDFMAQGGDPISRDQGCDFAGAGTSPEEIDVEVNERHGFWRGALGFALGMRRQNGSQFFVMTSPKPDLIHDRGPGEREPFTCFGRVLSGMEVVDRLEACDPLLRAEVLKP